jgi:hypothetical protein
MCDENVTLRVFPFINAYFFSLVLIRLAEIIPVCISHKADSNRSPPTLGSQPFYQSESDLFHVGCSLYRTAMGDYLGLPNFSCRSLTSSDSSPLNTATVDKADSSHKS